MILTKDNILFEHILDKQIHVRMTTDEFSVLETTAKANYISSAELVRNLIRENIFKYVSSLDVKKVLKISAQIDKILMNRRLISRKNEGNFSKTREILTDFEEYIDSHSKDIDPEMLEFRLSEILQLNDYILEGDTFLFHRVEPQLRRIFKNKRVKSLVSKIQLCKDI